MARTKKWVIEESSFPSKKEREEQLKFLLRYGILAANSHNSQPWIFEIKKSKIIIYPDNKRSLKIADPKKRELWISLGCVVENLILAGEHFGLHGKEKITDKKIEISFRKGPKKQKYLFDQITKRRTNRRKPKRLLIKKGDIAKLKKLVFEKETNAFLLDKKKDIKEIAKLIYQANEILYKNEKFIKEMISWTRFNKRQERRHKDGISHKALDIPPVTSRVGKIIMKIFLKSSYLNKEEKEKIENSTGIIIVTSKKDDKKDWVSSGRTLQRILLLLTYLEIDYAFENQPCQVPKTRKNLEKLTKDLPQALIRIGHAKEISHSVRRDIKDVLKNEKLMGNKKK